MKTDGPTKPNRPETLKDKMGCLKNSKKKKSQQYIFRLYSLSRRLFIRGNAEKLTVDSSIFYTPAY